ncbi:G-protein coupled receptor 84 [Trichosurus vulpecula]|uniref:G-protein coupled receptor 84 n=1 Tax=Trichosurus vulpecula TaxID=9337 RepID=UPI00186B2180|nr:G-protein coupled receptor 84 [Trichosurus vulpecula]
MLNTSDDANFSCYHPSVVDYRYVAVVWGVVVAVTGTAGNLLTLMIVGAQPKLRTHFNLLIANLTLADLIYCALLQPFSVDSYLYLRWRAGATFCRVFGLLLFATNSVAILTLCLIAFGRYLLIAHPTLFPRIFTAKGVALALFGTWVLGMASFAPLWPIYILVPVVCTCSFDRIRGRPYTTILMGIYFVLGLSCIGIFYCLIHRQVRRAAQALDQYKLRQTSFRPGNVAGAGEALPGHFQELDSGLASGVTSQGTSSEPGSTLESDSSKIGSQENNRLSRVEKNSQRVATHMLPAKVPKKAQDGSSEFGKVTRMCFVVFLFFSLSYIPFLLLNIFDARVQAPRVLHMLAANLTWLNGCINPVLYAAMNRQFREAYGSILRRGPQSFRRLR